MANCKNQPSRHNWRCPPGRRFGADDAGSKDQSPPPAAFGRVVFEQIRDCDIVAELEEVGRSAQLHLGAASSFFTAFRVGGLRPRKAVRVHLRTAFQLSITAMHNTRNVSGGEIAPLNVRRCAKIGWGQDSFRDGIGVRRALENHPVCCSRCAGASSFAK
jgi:hypothetical protein